MVTMRSFFALTSSLFIATTCTLLLGLQFLGPETVGVQYEANTSKTIYFDSVKIKPKQVKAPEFTYVDRQTSQEFIEEINAARDIGFSTVRYLNSNGHTDRVEAFLQLT